MQAQWSQPIYDYILEHTRLDDPLLREMEQRAERDHFPIIGPLVGPWLYLCTRLLGARRVFEMGSGYGYSTWYFAAGVRDNGGGTVSHTVWDEALSHEARGWMEKAGLLRYIDFQVSESILALSSEKAGIDIVFMDIDKEGYPHAVEIIGQKLRPGGLLLVDNVLWSGEVLDNNERDKAAVAVREFNDRLASDPRWDYVINPLRDGLGIARLRE